MTTNQTHTPEHKLISVNNTQSNKTLLTDLYQLTMLAAHHDNGIGDDTATFELFIRNLPHKWGYFLACGIEDAIDYATNIHFTDDHIDYLRGQALFTEDFLGTLKDFRFEGDIYAVKEGTPVFPNEPILRITAKRSQAQFLETALLNMINFQTLIASKASRVVDAADGRKVVDFGLRRAQEEDAGMKGARACYIAGAAATSNVKAGKEYDIPISGTMAHSFVMSFENEIDAFRAYVKTFSDNATLLIDTYDTIEGAKNAATAAKELEMQGHKLAAVRLDSGDLADLSIKVRDILDNQGLSYVKIFVSNDLNEYKIEDLQERGAKIDGYGVGTEMITAKPVSAISGVYKLVEDNHGAKIKLSDGKKTYPGKKQVYRSEDENGYTHDTLALEDESFQDTPLLERVVHDGIRISPRRDLDDIRQYATACKEKLPTAVRDIHGRHYEVLTSDRLNKLVDMLTNTYGGAK